jgi:pimeloyl-ACP methyl ester carboxylesterase
VQHDEFADLTTLATRVGAPEPLRASRTTVPTSGGDVSAIRWSLDGREARITYLHGLGGDAHGFDALALAVGEPAVALDLPGHGRSAWRDDARYGAPETAPTVIETLDALDVPAGLVVGHSLGAIVAARVAALAPERVTGLVLVDMSPDFTQRAVERIARALEDEPDFADLDAVVDHQVAMRVGDDRDVLRRDAAHTTVERDGARVRRHHFPHLPDGVRADVGRFADAWDDLEHADVPVLLVRGDRGYVSPKLADGFAERLPDATIGVLSARHAVHQQDPVGLAGIVRPWAARHGLL